MREEDEIFLISNDMRKIHNTESPYIVTHFYCCQYLFLSAWFNIRFDSPIFKSMGAGINRGTVNCSSTYSVIIEVS